MTAATGLGDRAADVVALPGGWPVTAVAGLGGWPADVVALLVAGAWGGLVLATGWRRRPLRSPAHDLRSVVRPSRPAADALALLGRAVRRSVGAGPDPTADQRTGVLVLATVAAGAVWLPAAALMVGLGVAAPRWRARSERRRRQEAIVAELPDIVDLFVLAVGAGLTVPLAVAAVTRRADGATGSALTGAIRRTALGEPLADALGRVVDEIGEPVRALVGALVATERYGTPLLPELDRVATEARLVRRRSAEVAARRLPVQLLFPLVLCTLPAFALLTVVPLLVSAFDTLAL